MTKILKILKRVIRVKLDALKEFDIEIDNERIRTSIQETIDSYGKDSDDIKNLDIGSQKEIYEEFKRIYSEKSGGEIISLFDKSDHVEWYKKENVKEGQFWNIYEQYLKEEENFSPASIRDIDANTDEIMGMIEDPLRQGPWYRKGVVIGSIQSGKTANYLGLINKARETGYKFFVILTGHTNDLRKQTQERIDEGHIGQDTFNFIENSYKYNWIGKARANQFGNDRIIPKIATTNDLKGDFDTAARKRLSLEVNGHYVFVIKKNKTPILNLIKWLENYHQQINHSSAANKFHKDEEATHLNPPFIKEFPIFLIDDECDYYSVDTGNAPKNNKGEYIDEYSPKTINKLIRRLLMFFDKKIYVGYTATAFANIFIHESKKTKTEGEDLFPRSFIFNINPPSNHSGLDSLFNLKDKDESDEYERSKFLIEVDDFSENIYSETSNKGWMPLRHKSTHNPVFDPKKLKKTNFSFKNRDFYLSLINSYSDKKNISMPPSLMCAIMTFIISCSIRNQRQNNTYLEHKTMLVHVSKFIAVNEIIEQQIINFLSIIKELISSNDVQQEFKSIYEQEFMPSLENQLNMNDEKLTFDELMGHNPYTIKSVINLLINNVYYMGAGNLGPDYREYKSKNKIGLHSIVLGGDKLGRGVTFKGLSVSYFLRSSKMYDTLMQMGRWFGYRRGYQDVCRLFSSDELIEKFTSINLANEEFRADIKLMQSQGLSPMKYGLKVKNSPGLLITSKSKMQDGTIHKISFSNTSLQSTMLSALEKDINKNFDLTETFFENIGINLSSDLPFESIDKKQKIKNALFAKNVESKYIINYLKNYIIHSDSAWNSKDVCNYISNSNNQNELMKWTVCMPGLSTPAHKLTFNIKNNELMMQFRKLNKQTSLDKLNYKAVWNPSHQSLDLSREEIDKAKNEYKLINSNSEIAKRDVFSSCLRRARSPINGLLILYPIIPLSHGDFEMIEGENLDDTWKQFKQDVVNDKILSGLKMKKPIIGWGISFPESNNPGIETEYTVNNIYSNQEYNDIEYNPDFDN